MLWYDKTSFLNIVLVFYNAYLHMFYRYFKYNAKMSIKLNAVKQFVIKIFPILLLPQIFNVLKLILELNDISNRIRP